MINLIIAESDKRDLLMLEGRLAEMGGLDIKKCSSPEHLYGFLINTPQILILGYNFLSSSHISKYVLIKELLNKYNNLSVIVSDNKFDSSKYFNLYASGVTSCLNFNRVDCYQNLQETIQEIKQKHLLQSFEKFS